MKDNNGKELHRQYDIYKQHIRTIELWDNFDLDTLLMITLELKMDKITRLKWMEYSNDYQNMPLHSKLLEFLHIQPWHFELVSSELKPQMTTHRSYETIIDWYHRFYMATVNREEVCVACGRGGNHVSGSCGKFQGMAREERWDPLRRVPIVRIVYRRHSTHGKQVSSASYM